VSDVGEPAAQVVAALSDDLNTPLAISKLHEMAGVVNKLGDPVEQAAVRAEMLASAKLLGLLWSDPEAWFQGGGGVDHLDEAKIQHLIDARTTARTSKDFAEADRVRDTLKAMGVVLEDGAGGTMWKRG